MADSEESLEAQLQKGLTRIRESRAIVNFDDDVPNTVLVCAMQTITRHNSVRVLPKIAN